MTDTNNILPVTQEIPGVTNDITGNSQPKVVDPVGTTVTNPTPASATPGPDVAFANLRKENEALRSQAAIANDPEVQAFLQKRESEKALAEATKLGMSQQAYEKLHSVETQFNALQEQQIQAAIAENGRATMQRFGMDSAGLQAFATYAEQEFPFLTEALMKNPKLDLEPYIKAFNPAMYLQWQAGHTAAPVARTQFIPGHGTSVSLAAEAAHKQLLEAAHAAASVGLTKIKK